MTSLHAWPPPAGPIFIRPCREHFHVSCVWTEVDDSNVPVHHSVGDVTRGLTLAKATERLLAIRRDFP